MPDRADGATTGKLLALENIAQKQFLAMPSALV
jgi:hypothetical protein